ncbi:MAG: PAS domain S-box protein [Acidobacteria bacterium]|nr:PAS domain S-box protein [Acidobacteriota bacterium]
MSLLAAIPQRDEAERLRTLLHYEVLGKAQDPAFSELAVLAAQFTLAPYAYIGFLDANRLWFGGTAGFQGLELARNATPCRVTVLEQQPLLVRDAASDPHCQPGGVIEPSSGIQCRSYLAVPLVAPNGEPVGTLAVLSPLPHAFREQQIQALEVLARQVITRLEFYNRSRLQERIVRARQRVERALTVERNFVSAVLDTISALVLVLDTAGRVVRFNRACERVSGLSFAELVGRTLPANLALSEECEPGADMLSRVRSGMPYAGETNWISRDGKRRRIDWTATPLSDHMGEVNFIIATGVDVTSQREAELALRESETRYRQLVEGSLGMVCTHDMEGRLLSINTHAAAGLGYQPEELIGTHIIDLIPESYRPGWQTYAQNLRDHGDAQGRLHLQHKNGEVRVIAYRNKLLALPETEPFVLGHGIDVTEKTEAENRAHTLMRQRESILESVGDGIYGIDLEGCILFVNEVGANMLGYSSAEVEGKKIHDLIHHSRPDGTPYPHEECPIDATPFRKTPLRVRDEVFWRKDGIAIPVEYVACPLITNGQPTGTVVAFQDVTERRRLDRMKDEFISTVSHELRTPLTSLRAALGLIGGGVLDKRPEKMAQMLDVAIGNCDRLVRLVNDILDFERINSGRLQLVYGEVNAVDLLRRATDLQHSSATRAGIVFRIDAEPVNLWVDSDRILQTLTNLISNAIKFSPHESEIRLRAHALNDTQAVLEVQDRGRGIPPEKLEMIFERFQQVDASDSREMGGTGLGLAICRSIVHHHGGRIWAESNEGSGSTFFFTVPRGPLPGQPPLERTITPVLE